MHYDHKAIEEKWQKEWRDRGTYRAIEDPIKPKYYVLDMFPYPSGAGLHVGHPLGYIASDIVARYKRHQGHSVLHPMGYDAFGLPAEQYAIQTGQHPAVTTEVNIKRYREQLDRIGFSFDWEREVRTSDPAYYKWTQWIFLQLFDSWYDPRKNKAEPIKTLIEHFELQGYEGPNDPILTGDLEEEIAAFSASEWKGYNETTQQRILQNFRLAYLSEAWVNWCAALGTVLANDEVKDGVSERGGHPVERKRMPQWSLRITAYAQRLLEGLDTIDWSESIKESQRNWIGRSEGALVRFVMSPFPKLHGEHVTSDAPGLPIIEVFTTRPDTLFGVTFITLAPEHELVEQITTTERMEEVRAHVKMAKDRSERERQAEVKRVSGVFTGAFCIHPFTGEEIPVWVGDYVLAGYGTGAVMAVPGGDQRDWNFATHFGIPIKAVTEGADVSKEADERKDATIANSEFLNGMPVEQAITRAIDELVSIGAGERRINYRLRDAAFGRQRYWGEPIPIYYKDGVPYPMKEEHLPLVLPEIDKYQPTEDGEPPLARARDWYYSPLHGRGTGGEGQKAGENFSIETTTMPGWAGSSWYFLRYMDPKNPGRFAAEEKVDYWKQIDLYMGGAEHATGHLLYFRFWTKFLFDRGWIPFDEPAKKLVNQGMIQGVSKFYEEIRVIPEKKAEWDRKPKELLIKRNGQVLKSINIPAMPNGDPTGFNIYHSHGTDLSFEFFDPIKKEAISTRRSTGHANSDFTKDVVVDGKTQSVHTLLDGWLRVEQAYWPIIITSIPIDAFWHYENREWRDFFDRPVSDQQIPLWLVRSEVEKMSKSKLNVVTPDDKIYEPEGIHVKCIGRYFDKKEARIMIPGIIEKYGADTFRLYEMFLGPLEQSKPWDTNGIEGTSRFLRKFWNLFHPNSAKRSSENDPIEFSVSEEEPTKAELKVLHATVKKVSEDIDRMSFNTSVSQFMIAANQLAELKCNKRQILEPLTIALAPFAPHIAEELWQLLGHTESITTAPWPAYDEQFLIEDNFNYPISFNGKTRLLLEFPIALSKEEVEAAVLANPEVQERLEGKQPKKVIVVPKRIVNIVV